MCAWYLCKHFLKNNFQLEWGGGRGKHYLPPLSSEKKSRNEREANKMFWGRHTCAVKNFP